ncbi:enolase C-terminal domain-like protein [Pseudomonas sp. H11T01]|uniref:enolase C-terminal domain-like protein n=1 Tax=Pseudomonas sp. H11T01 TaxID=3402749 RepID=UPI003AD04B42
MQLISEKAADGIGLKVSKHGGLTRARRLRDMCMTSGLTMSVQETAGSQVAFAALTHLGQSILHRNLRCVLDTRDMYDHGARRHSRGGWPYPCPADPRIGPHDQSGRYR